MPVGYFPVENLKIAISISAGGERTYTFSFSHEVHNK